MNKEFLRKFAEWATPLASLVFTDEEYWKAMKELMAIAMEYPEVMDR